MKINGFGFGHPSATLSRHNHCFILLLPVQFNPSMKEILLTAVFSLLAMGVFAQLDTYRLFDLKDENSLLNTLFDGDSTTANGEVLWEPYTFSDEISARLSDDGWMHTRLDTILYYTSFDVFRAVAVFETLHYDQGEVYDCSSCGAQISLALFDKYNEGAWYVQRFAKHITSLGSYGYGGDIGLAQFGDNQWCLSMEMNGTAQGVTSDYLSFLNLEDFSKVFNLVIHEDNMGELGLELERSYAYDKAIHLLPNIETVTGWWEFDLVSQGTEPDFDVQRAVPANTVQRFGFNWETGTYMKICP